jgi:hypothetical protein
MPQRYGFFELPFDGREIPVVDVDGQQPESIGLGARHEDRELAMQVHMRVDLLDACEVLDRVGRRRCDTRS